MSWDESARCFLDNVAQAGILTTPPAAAHAMPPARDAAISNPEKAAAAVG